MYFINFCFKITFTKAAQMLLFSSIILITCPYFLLPMWMISLSLEIDEILLISSSWACGKVYTQRPWVFKSFFGHWNNSVIFRFLSIFASLHSDDIWSFWHAQCQASSYTSLCLFLLKSRRWCCYHRCYHLPSASWCFTVSYCHTSRYLFCCEQVISVHAASISYSLVGC